MRFFYSFFFKEIFHILPLECRNEDQIDKHPPHWQQKRQFELFFTFSALTDKDNFPSVLYCTCACAHTHTHSRTGPHKHKHTHTCSRLTPLDKSRLEHLAAVEVRVNRWRLNPRLRYKQLDKSQSIAAIATATAQYFHCRHCLGLGNSSSIYLCCDKPVKECVCVHTQTHTSPDLITC